MGKRTPYTPKSQIRSALRRLFLRSRERAARIKADKYSCQVCGAKQSRAQGREVFVECHHVEGVCNWDRMFEVIYQELLCDPSKMRTLCKTCHSKMEVKS